MVWPFRSPRGKALIRIARLEKRAERAYDAMYDSRRPKDCWDDARAALAEAIQVATAAGLNDGARRLQGRLEHMRAVYQSQFR